MTRRRRPAAKPATTTAHVPTADGWEGGSLGGDRDKSVAITYCARPRLTARELEALYKQEPIVARVVDKIVDDALSTPWRLKTVTVVEGDPPVDVAQVRSDLDDLQFNQRFAEAAKWSRLYGGGLLAMGILDAQDPALLPKPGAPLISLGAVPAERAIPRAQDVGFGSPTYGRVLQYQVIGLASSAIEVHHARVIPFEPIKLPIEALQRDPFTTNGWGPSVIDRIFDALQKDGTSASHALAMMFVASVLYVQVQSWAEDVKAKNGKARMRANLAELRAQLDSLGILAMGPNDKIGNLSLSVTGAHELVDKMRDRLAAAVDGMPREILFNEAPTGLRGGELSGARAIWNSTVDAWRRSELVPALDRVLEVYFASKGIRALSWEIEFDPLYKPDAQTSAEIVSKLAPADASNIEAGVYTADEVREQRCVQGNLGAIAVAADAVTPLDMGAEVAGAEAAAAPTAAPDASVQDQALNGAQSASLSATTKDYNAGLLSYNQALGILTLSIPGRDVSIALGTPPADRDARLAVPVTSAPAAGAAPAADEAGPAEPPPNPHAPPSDPASVRQAAQQWGVPTRALTIKIQRGELSYWGIGAHKIVSLSEVGRLAKGHEGELAAEAGDAPEPAADPVADAIADSLRAVSR